MNCDPIARWYRWLEYIGFGSELERRRSAFLTDVATARRALVLGDGDGRFLASFVEQNPGCAIDSIDKSRRMLDLARNRAGSDSVTYRQADALTIPYPTGEYDLIVTHFFLDCFDATDLAKLVKGVSAAARPQAQWLISEFRQPECGIRAIWVGLWLRGLYLFFRMTTGLENRRLVDHHPLLTRYGFRLKCQESALFGLLASELWIR